MSERAVKVAFDLVYGWYGVSMGEICGVSRHDEVVAAREMVVYLTRRNTRMSFPEIARAIGRKSHSTAKTAFDRLEAEMDKNNGLRIFVEERVEEHRCAVVRSKKEERLPKRNPENAILRGLNTGLVLD